MAIGSSSLLGKEGSVSSKSIVPDKLITSQQKTTDLRIFGQYKLVLLRKGEKKERAQSWVGKETVNLKELGVEHEYNENTVYKIPKELIKTISSSEV